MAPSIDTVRLGSRRPGIFPCTSGRRSADGGGNEVGPRKGTGVAVDEGRPRRAARLPPQEGRDLEAARRRQRRNQRGPPAQARRAYEGRARSGRREPPHEARDREGGGCEGPSPL